MIPFNPAIEPENSLTGLQKYLLRVILLHAGETVFHRGRTVEVVDTHDSLRLLMLLVEPDLSEGNSTQAFWAPTRPADRQQFDLDRRDKSRRHQSIGVSSGEGRPHGARGVRLQTRFPSTLYLTYLVENLGYDGTAVCSDGSGSPAVAAFRRPSSRNRTAPIFANCLREAPVRTCCAVTPHTRRRWADGRTGIGRASSHANRS
jgi:hypothetical protein